MDPVVPDNKCGHDFSPHGIWTPDNRDVFDAGKLCDEMFDLSGINILASGDHGVLGTPADAQIAVFVDVPAVSSDQPSIPEGGRGLLVAPVPEATCGPRVQTSPIVPTGNSFPSRTILTSVSMAGGPEDTDLCATSVARRKLTEGPASVIPKLVRTGTCRAAHCATSAGGIGAPPPRIHRKLEIPARGNRQTATSKPASTEQRTSS